MTLLLPLTLLTACLGGGDTGWDSASCETGSGPIAYDDDPSNTRDDPFDERTLQEHVGYLASMELRGRAPGSEGGALAIAYIQDAFQSYGLTAPEGGWTQPFTDSNGDDTANVIGVRVGSDPQVSDEILVLVAHHDHLGTLDGQVYRGANDNASGVAALLALADAFSREAPPRRTLVFLSTGSEEVSYDGSRAYLRDPPADLPRASTVYAINLDMVGSYAWSELVYALNAWPSSPGRAALEAVQGGTTLSVDTRYEADSSDLESFCAVSIPGLMLWTEDPYYHTPCDIPAHIDYLGMAAIASLTGAMVRELADGEYGLVDYRSQGCGAR